MDSVKAALKWGKLDIRVIPIIEEAQIIEVTGWTPKEIEETDVEKIRVYSVIWSARGVTTRKENRELKGFG